MGDTQLYEAALKHQEDGRLGILAVKSGGSNPVAVELVVESVQKDDAEVFVFSTHSLYDGIPEDLGATRITNEQLARVGSRVTIRFTQHGGGDDWTREPIHLV
jgi:hypothetical protein